MTPGSDHFLAELFRGTQGPIYFCVLRNNKSKLQSGEVAHIITRDLNKIEGFRDKWDRPEHECGIYFHTATLKPGATQRNKETCFQFTAIFADIDDKNHLLSDRANVLELLDDCACPPSIVVDSGHGLQAHWLFNQPCADLDRVVTLRKKLRGLTASDPVHDAPRVMRLPGTHNSKGGDWIEAVVVRWHPERRYAIAQLEAWLAIEQIIIPGKEEPKPKPEEKPKHNGGAPRFYDDVPDLAVVREALRFIPNDDRKIWRNVGFALHAEFGDAGRSLWDEWSAPCKKYKAKDQDRAWSHFNPGGGITIGTLFHYAQQNGWQSPRRDGRSDSKTKTDAEDADELPPEAEDAIALVFAERHATNCATSTLGGGGLVSRAHTGLKTLPCTLSIGHAPSAARSPLSATNRHAPLHRRKPLSPSSGSPERTAA